MPVKVATNLPAIGFLEKENIFVMTDSRANRQEIRPLRLAILNLMPDKINTETQILRLISNTPLQVEVSLIRTATHESKHTPDSHLKSFYSTFDDAVKSGKKFDGLIITGAPVEKLDFSDVEYWEELKRVMDFAEHNVYSTMFICWAAQAAVFYHYGINKSKVDQKISGIFNHKVLLKHNSLVRGFDDEFFAPHSRHTEVSVQDVKKCGDVDVLAVSDEAGLYLAASKDGRKAFVFGHGEYDADTIHNEYERDKAKGLNPETPKNYYVGGDKKIPKIFWRAHSSLLFSNWLNYCVYQGTPYDINDLDKIK